MPAAEAEARMVSIPVGGEGGCAGGVRYGGTGAWVHSGDGNGGNFLPKIGSTPSLEVWALSTLDPDCCRNS